MKTHTTLNITKKSRRGLGKIAGARGFYQTRGPGVGQPCLSALIESIGRGECAVVLLTDAALWALIDHLERLAEETEDKILATAAEEAAKQFREAAVLRMTP